VRLSSIALWNWHTVATVSNWANIVHLIYDERLRRRDNKLFSDAIKCCRKLAVGYECQVVSVQEESWQQVDSILQHFTTAGEAVRNSFTNKRVTVNCNEFLLRESNGHASVAYSSIGKHVTRIILNTISSEANRSTLLYNAIMNVIKCICDLDHSNKHNKTSRLQYLHSREYLEATKACVDDVFHLTGQTNVVETVHYWPNGCVEIITGLSINVYTVGVLWPVDGA